MINSVIPNVIFYTQFIYVHIMLRKTLWKSNICLVYPKPKQTHGTKPPCQMFVKISHSLAGSSIIFDYTLLGTHFLFGKRGPLLVSFFLHVTGVQNNTAGTEDWRKKREQWQARVNNLSVIKAPQWKRTLCTTTGVKQIARTQSFSDTTVHVGEEGGVPVTNH